MFKYHRSKEQYAWQSSAIVLLLNLFICGQVSAEELSGNTAFKDLRQIRDAGAPQWLYSVARLAVPASRYIDGRRQHHVDTCSATLLQRDQRGVANILLTAWHCLEYYNDLSKPLQVTFTTATGTSIVRDAHRVDDGGGMHADWALLRLQETVATSAVPALTPLTDNFSVEQPLLMAGYSRDTSLGRSGEVLTYDPHCHITAQDRHSTATNCLAHKGASGGAVVQRNDKGQAQLIGVISEGDGAGYSSFVQVARLRAVLHKHLP